MKLITGLLLGLLLTTTSQGQEIETGPPVVKEVTIHGESNEELMKRLGIPLSQFGLEPKEVKEEVKEKEKPKKKRKRKRKRKAKKMSSEVTWDFELDNIITMPELEGVDPNNMTDEQWQKCHSILLEKLKVLIKAGDISFAFDKKFIHDDPTPLEDL